MDFTKNVRIESYSEKDLLARLCRAGADRQVDMECTSTYASRTQSYNQRERRAAESVEERKRAQTTV